MTPTVRTLGEFVDGEGIVAWLGEQITQNHGACDRGAADVAKRARLPMSCSTCAVTKACCSSYVVIRLYEGVLLAATLKQSGRDTPELRAELRERAEAMEAARASNWWPIVAESRPCVFLDPDERCSVYAVRPTTCAQLYVYSEPQLCVARSSQIRSYTPRDEVVHANQIEEAFREKLALRKKVGRRYLGVLPRMVLVALEAWDRTDFRDYLRQLSWPTEAEWADIVAMPERSQ
jgi:Fe-S-cluster containining protein